MKRNFNFFSFWLLIVLGMITTVFSSYSKDDANSNNVTNSSTSDQGVIINGIKWATRNVAAPGFFTDKPEDMGMFYQWNRKTGWPATGATSDWDSSISEGEVWKNANDPCPAGWRIPTYAEIMTLFDTNKVTNEWVIENGVTGAKFTEKASGHSIFLPAAGSLVLNGGELIEAGTSGRYWSSVEFSNVSAYDIYFYSVIADWSASFRSCGFSIRAVAE